MRIKYPLVCFLVVMMLSVKAQRDTILDFIHKAESLQEKEERIISHGGRLLYNDPVRLPELAANASVLAKKLKSPRLKAAVYNLKGLYARHRGALDSSVFYHKKSLSILRKLPEQIQLSREYNHLSITLHELGKYEQYLAYNDSAIAQAQSVNSEDYKQVLLNNRAYILLQLGDTTSTKRLLKKILPQMNDVPGSKAATYENLSRVYQWQNQPDSALYCLERALKLSNDAGELRLEGELLQQLGSLYFQQEEIEEAEKHWRMAWQIFHQLGSVQDELYARSQMYYVLMNQGERGKALSLLDSTLRESRAHGFAQMSYDLLQQKTQHYEEVGNPAAALKSLRSMLVLKDSLQNDAARKQIVELETKYQAREKEQELLALRQDRDLKAAKMNLVYILFATGFILLLLLLTYVRFYYRSKQRISENDRARLNAEVSKRQMEEQKLRGEIELKSQQLTSKALSLSERNELLTRLLDKMRKARSGSDVQRNELLKMAEREISIKLRNQAEWREFSTYFEEVNSGFAERLRTNFPQLSQKELRLLALTKLGLTTKEISNLLHVAPDSVKMARYRLKKKLQLTEGDTIEIFLESLNGQHSES